MMVAKFARGGVKNPKSEARNQKQCPRSKQRPIQVRISNLGFGACFGFRISDFFPRSSRAAESIGFALQHLLFRAGQTVQAVLLDFGEDAADLGFLLGELSLLSLPAVGIAPAPQAAQVEPTDDARLLDEQEADERSAKVGGVAAGVAGAED